MKHSIDKQLISSRTAEFHSKFMEDSFLSFTWNDNKIPTRNTLLAFGFLVIAFFVRDVLETKNSGVIYLLLIMRLVMFCALFTSSVYLHRTTSYFRRYHQLLLFNQFLISTGILIFAVLREMPFAYLGVNTVILTLIYYQFINNRFCYSVIACGFTGAAAVFTGMIFLNMSFSDLAASILFLVPLNFLGITILRSINRSRRSEFLALSEMKKSIDEQKKTNRELRQTLAEVKVLRGFLPICAKCKKIRDDKGYWNQIESYIEQHSEAQFSHGICQECAKELYGNQGWYIRKYGKDKSNSNSD